VTYPGVLSDRIGRMIPFSVGVILLAGSTLLFAFAPSLVVLILARLLQGTQYTTNCNDVLYYDMNMQTVKIPDDAGVAGACTWASGLAIVDDNYKGSAHGRAMGMYSYLQYYIYSH